MRRFSIGDIENLTGIKAHTIRIWEQRYQFFTSKRSETNIRYYDDDDLCLFLNVATLSENGYKISKISKMQTDEIKSLVKTLQTDTNQPETHLQLLFNAMVKLDEHDFEEIINKLIAESSLEKIMEEILFPFLYKVGMMWQVGTINPAHEHFATHKIQQKIIEATYKEKVKTLPDAKKYVLFLPPNEQHELGLLFAQYLLKKHGHHCLYLGQSLPYETLKDVVAYYQPDYAFTVLTSSKTDANVNVTLDSLRKVIGATELVVTGNQIANYENNCCNNTHLIKNISSFLSFIRH